ncbi:response regulator transcription factor [Nocardioides caricicola]|uniref:LuxR C-terminal-related transcriptional regulator n=1 Tax=Nocardioides caricicola TaxID=634770 RepID=A0ABW0N333_9ACTN
MPAGVAKVAVLSPHPVVVEGFTAMLSRYHDRVEVIDLPTSFDDLEPDVVLYDVAALADGDGVELDELVKRTASVVLAIERPLRPDLLGRALSRGVDGFFSAAATEEELVAAVESALTGWQAGDPGPDPVVGSSTSEQRSHRLGTDVGLTPREMRILELIAQGLSNDQIAAQEFISINTVKSSIRVAYRKIDVHTRPQAVAWAVRHGVGTDIER